MSNAAAKPKHAPSAKLALDDVLKSLQDLIRNDLPDVSSATGPRGEAEPAPMAQADPDAPQPSAKDLILELEAGLAELNAFDTDTALIEPLATAVDHDLGGEPLTNPPPASSHTPGAANVVGVEEKGIATPEALAKTRTTSSMVDLQSALRRAAGLPEDASANPDTDSPTGVRWEQKPAVAFHPPVDAPSDATRPKPPPVTVLDDTDTLRGVDLADDTTVSQVSEFLQDEPPADTELASLDNVHLDFSDHGDTFTIERDQSLGSAPDSPHAPTDGLSWHTPEFSLPTAEIPEDVTLSPLDGPATLSAPGGAPAVSAKAQPGHPWPAPLASIPSAKAQPGHPWPAPLASIPSAKKSSGGPNGGLQSELPLTDPISSPPYADLPRPSAEINAARISPTTSSPAATAVVTPDAHPSTANWDNIPLLQDVIDAVESPADSRTPAPNPSAEQARRMAIQVAARLNVELRRSGKHALSSDILTRLARVLQETLAQSPPNVDNKPHNKN